MPTIKAINSELNAQALFVSKLSPCRLAYAKTRHENGWIRHFGDMPMLLLKCFSIVPNYNEKNESNFTIILQMGNLSSIIR